MLKAWKPSFQGLGAGLRPSTVADIVNGFLRLAEVLMSDHLCCPIACAERGSETRQH